MKDTRIEILKDGVWVALLLKDNQTIKYNIVINKIGSMSNREISHSNTFELPFVNENIQALGINIFNKTNLAKAFNSRYIARYYVKDKLTQKGYLIINNTGNGAINVNFIDEALDIIESWGSMNYYELLNSTTINIPEDYKEGIKIMQDYVMNQTEILPPLEKIETRGYHLAKFPNNLNAIGDKFQKNKDDVRLTDKFNPYQSRPIFNVKALFDIAIESFGYTPIYDDSVDWLRLSKTYMIDKDQSQSQDGDNTNIERQYPKINSNSVAMKDRIFTNLVSNIHLFVYPSEVNSIYPKDLIPTWNASNYWRYIQVKDYKNLDRCILIPDTSVSFSGFMKWKFSIITSGFANDNLPEDRVIIKAIWKNAGENTGYVSTPLTKDEFEVDANKVFSVKVNKTQLSVPPVGTTELLGVTVEIDIRSLSFNNIDKVTSLINLIYTESFLPKDTISYDEFSQYEALNINLTHAAPRDTIKDLLSAVMQKEGILISFDNKLKQIKLFTYGSYITRKIENKFKDWSDYFLSKSRVSYSTDYGNEYAKKNEVGLSSPFKGNTIMVDLLNQGSDSKYKDFIQNLSKKFKDVEDVLFVQNEITPYFEYTNKGLGLVESPNNGLGELTQVRASGTTQGTFSGLAQVYNVNGLNLPNGLVEWYDIIDNSVKVEGTFLIPVDEMKTLDMSEPIYVEGLGGFYIIEEVQEYVDAQTPVNIKLIKMIIPSITIDPDDTNQIYDTFYYDDNFYET